MKKKQRGLFWKSPTVEIASLSAIFPLKMSLSGAMNVVHCHGQVCQGKVVQLILGPLFSTPLSAKDQALRERNELNALQRP